MLVIIRLLPQIVSKHSINFPDPELFIFSLRNIQEGFIDESVFFNYINYVVNLVNLSYPGVAGFYPALRGKSRFLNRSPALTKRAFVVQKSAASNSVFVIVTAINRVLNFFRLVVPWCRPPQFIPFPSCLGSDFGKKVSGLSPVTMR